MKQIGERQAVIERIRVKQKEIESSICFQIYGEIICARCQKQKTIWLDEIEGRHDGEDSWPSSIRPTNHQLLCEDCHRIKTEGLEFGHHFDYVSKNLPKLKIYLLMFQQEIGYRIPDLNGTRLKHDLKDILKATTLAGKVVYAAL